MTTLHAGTVLTPEERLARRSLILRDALALLTLFLITSVLFTLTWLLHRSFDDHREELGERWEIRGMLALKQGHPKDAIEDLRSALAYVPNRETEIELATALAESGRTTEATAYFNTLWDSAPGDGTINLELARLAARTRNQQQAIFHYQAALDGTWNGNGYDRRREVRLELARYLLTQKQFDQARTQLLIAAGNAPDDPAIKTEIAGILAQAHDLPSALGIYRAVAARRPAPPQALEGAGRTAFALGMYRVAADYLGRLMAQNATTPLPDAEVAADREMLDTSTHLLLLFPAPDLRPGDRASRILAIKNTARQRLTACASTAGTVAPQLSGLISRWDQLPQHLTSSTLAEQPDLEQTILQLVYDTETSTAQICGAPAGTDALLLRIASNPAAVEQQ